MKKHPFTLPLVRPFNWGGGELRSREGEVWAGDKAMVEWAPFPGLHQCLDRYRHYLLSELAFWEGVNLVEAKDISFHGLMSYRGREDEWEYLKSFSVIKVKCARDSVSRDIEFFHFLCRKFPRARFRLDANRLWSEGELEQFILAVDEKRIDYFEEPTPHSLDLTERFPIALDETILTCSEWESLKSARALVIKPHLYGDMEQVLELMDWGKSRGIPIVLSALFNSSVGTQNLLRLATLCPDSTVHGLDPYFYLARDTVKNPLVSRGDYFPACEVAKTLGTWVMFSLSDYLQDSWPLFLGDDPLSSRDFYHLISRRYATLEGRRDFPATARVGARGTIAHTLFE